MENLPAYELTVLTQGRLKEWGRLQLKRHAGDVRLALS